MKKNLLYTGASLPLLTFFSCALFGGGGLSLNPANLVTPSNAIGAMQAAEKMENQQQACQVLRQAKASPEEAAALGRMIDMRLVQAYGPLVGTADTDSEELKKAVAHINTVCKAVTMYSPNGQGTEVGVLVQGGKNAFSSPSGRLLIGQDLIKKLRNDNEIAFVCAHERGHVDADHAIELYQTIKADQCDQAVMGKVAGTLLDVSQVKVLVKAPGGILNLTDPAMLQLFGKLANLVYKKVATGFYGKEQEYGADRAGMDMVAALQLDTTASMAVLDHLPKSGAADHPSSAQRKTALDKHLKGVVASSDDAFSPLVPGATKVIAFGDVLKPL